MMNGICNDVMTVFDDCEYLYMNRYYEDERLDSQQVYTAAKAKCEY